MKQSTVAVSDERLKKLGVICIKGGKDKSEFIGDFIDAFYQLMTEAHPDSERISITNWHVDLIHSKIELGFTPFLDYGQLPPFVKHFYECQQFIEDCDHEPTRDELLKKGFEPRDIDLLLLERKERAEKKE